ncbi:MAG: hypothetical protein C4520_08285 [Candidatus Abyssobacteria bacterium SURF_5]|uniref:Uncharacterized protein n=1 Tax=Abyssobacteria bacterium (strain SURF_5) TaxID=2093360 RepID=A0A3A4NUY4_ABYX5|nr:MAG: hypothetical protein C4520_08285 [Candidatus Abyssubacteria bacterium SURF_5]
MKLETWNPKPEPIIDHTNSHELDEFLNPPIHADELSVRHPEHSRRISLLTLNLELWTLN